jgi:hypothetical protein
MEFKDDPAAWCEVLRKIEYAFDKRWAEDYGDYEKYFEELKQMTREEKDEHYKKVQEGFELFGKYFCNLWD